MCPLRFILVFFSAALAAYFAWTTVRSSSEIDLTTQDQNNKASSNKDNFSFNKVPTVPFFFLVKFTTILEFLLFNPFSSVSDDSEWILGICWHGQREVYMEKFDIQDRCSSKELLDVGTSQILIADAETFNSLFYFHSQCEETCKFLSSFSFCKRVIGKWERACTILLILQTNFSVYFPKPCASFSTLFSPFYASTAHMFKLRG